MEKECRALLRELNVPLCAEVWEETPKRMAKSLQFLTSGYSQKLEEVVSNAIWEEDTGEGLVLVKDIEFYSLCEHHMLPFYGVVHIGYIPDNRVVGLSKLPRIVEMYARRLQLQERLTLQLLGAIEKSLSPLGAAVMVQAHHLCMKMRGVENQKSSTTTALYAGELRKPHRQAEFLHLTR